MRNLPPVTVAEAVAKGVLLVTGTTASLVVYIELSDKPFGWQIATAIWYTAAILCFVFFRWRGMPEWYSPSDKRIQQQIPLLVAIHLFTIVTSG